MVRQWSRRRVLEVEAGGTRYPLTKTYRKSWRQNARERLQGPMLGNEAQEFIERPAILPVGGEETYEEVALQLMIYLAQWHLVEPDGADMNVLKQYLKGLFRPGRFRQSADDEVAGRLLTSFTHPERPSHFRHYCRKAVRKIYYQRLREQHSNQVEFQESSPGKQGRRVRSSDDYSAHELAGLSGLKPRTIYELMHDGKLPAVKRGGSLRVNKEDAEHFLDE